MEDLTKFIRIIIYLFWKRLLGINSKKIINMAKKKNFRNEEISVIAGMIRDSFARDRADFEAFSPKYSEPFLTGLNEKIIAVETRTGTKVFLAQQKALTTKLYEDIDSLRPKLTRLEGYLYLAKGTMNVAEADFGISAVRKKLGVKDVEGLLDKLTHTLQLIDTNTAALEAVGFTAEAKTELENLKQLIQTTNLEQNLKMDEKEAGVQSNDGLLTELMEIVTEIMDIGKRLYKYDNVEKTGDYTATTLKTRIRHEGGSITPTPTVPEDGILLGAVTDKANDKPMLGVSVEITEKELLQITDEDGEYNFDAVEAGSYTVKAKMEGYVDTVIQNVTVTMDEVTELDLEMMGA